MGTGTHQPPSALLPESVVPHEAHEQHLDVLTGAVCAAVLVMPRRCCCWPEEAVQVAQG